MYIYDLHVSVLCYILVRMIKYRLMRHVMCGRDNAYSTFRKFGGKRQLGGPRHLYEHNILFCVWYCIAFKRWVRIDPALALLPLISTVLPLLDYLFVKPTLLMKRRIFLIGASWSGWSRGRMPRVL